jgi:hypothetical protein
VLNRPQPRRDALNFLIESVGLATSLRAYLEKKSAGLDSKNG